MKMNRRINRTRKIAENSKITLTFKQLKQLIKESYSDEDLDDYGTEEEPTIDAWGDVVGDDPLDKLPGDFVIQHGILIKYKGNSKDVVIPDDVWMIGPNAFADCSSLNSVTIPGSVEEIGHDAFRNAKLITLEIEPGDLKKFDGNTTAWIKNIILPDTIEKVELHGCLSNDPKVYVPNEEIKKQLQRDNYGIWRISDERIIVGRPRR